MAGKNELEYQSDVLPQSSFNFFQDIRERREYCDVVLRVADLTIPAHSIVVAAAIPFLRDALRSKGSQNEVDIPEVDDLKPRAIQSMIEYAYQGKIKSTLEDAMDLLPVACRFQVNEMSDVCCRFLAENFTPKNVMKVQNLGRQLGCQDLVQSAGKYIAENFVQISEVEEFLDCSFSDLNELIKRDDLLVENEEKVYESVMKWITHASEREEQLPELIRNVRLILLEPSYLRLHVARNKLIRDSICRDWVDEITTYLMFPKDVQLSSEFNIQPRRYVNTGGSKTHADEEGEISLENANGEKSLGDRIQHKQLQDIKDSSPDARMHPGTVQLAGPGTVQLAGPGTVQPHKQQQVFMSLRNPGNKHIETGRGHEIDQEHDLDCTDTECAEEECDGIYAFHARLVFSIQHFNDKTKRWNVKKRDYFTINTALVTRLNDTICFLDCENMCYYNPGNKEISFTDRYVQGRASVTVGDQLYIFGGSDGHTVFDSVECFDLQNEEWSDLESMQMCREYACSVALGEYLYVIGGNDSEYIHRAVERYDIQEKKWDFVEPTLTGRCKLGAASLNGKIYICGGITSLEAQECALTAEVYDPNIDQWVPIRSMNTPRINFTLLPYNDKLYAVGGCDENDAFLNATDVYNPRTKRWELGYQLAPELQITGAAVM